MKAGLYHPDEFKDNCGFGLIAHMQGEPSHTLLQTAIEALTCMTHRGGINADGKTGDGCGLLIQKPDLFLRATAKEQFGTDLPKQYAVGMVFFNQDPIKAEAARDNMNREILAAGLQRLMGKGVAALQKVGVLQITPLSIPRIDVLGVYPSIQTVTAQVLILLIIVASVAYNLRSQRAATQS